MVIPGEEEVTPRDNACSTSSLPAPDHTGTAPLIGLTQNLSNPESKMAQETVKSRSEPGPTRIHFLPRGVLASSDGLWGPAMRPRLFLRRTLSGTPHPVDPASQEPAPWTEGLAALPRCSPHSAGLFVSLPLGQMSHSPGCQGEN